MTKAERFLRAAGLTIKVWNADSPEARARINAYFSELQQRFDEGFDPSNTVSAEPDELTPPSGYFLLAWLDSVPVGCVALKVQAGTGEVKRMWVSKSASGLGVAQRLLESVEQLARDVGIQKLQLDTNRRLTEALALYRRNGYCEIAAYNDNPYAHHWFEKNL